MATTIETLFESVARGDLSAVRAALEADPSLAAARDRQMGSTPLHHAAHQSH
jgi:hypothetical protein